MLPVSIDALVGFSRQIHLMPPVRSACHRPTVDGCELS